MTQINKSASVAILIVVIVVSLIYLKSIIVPLILAAIFWLIVVEVRTMISKLISLKDAKMPVWLQNLFASIMIFSILFVVVKLLSLSIQNLSESMSHYDGNLQKMEDKINAVFDINITKSLNKMVGDTNFTSLLRTVLSSVTDLFGNAFTILLYVVFLLLEESGFGHKIRAMYPESNDQESVIKLLERVSKTVSSYLTLKTFVSVITGVLSYFVLLFVGIDAPFFWAAIIFLLNYIPTIGSLIATLFPSAFIVIQTGEPSVGLLVLIAVGAIQVVIGNFVEPKMMGNSLNVSGLVVLIALAFWGTLWGVIGMILSVPITVLMIIVFAEFESTRKIAILLSEDGNIGKPQIRNLEGKE
ncbi:AI-2E family transporter [Flammeovirga sp. MY04]|uniref:AI-2E family transporter n=1 Tax=Flammeovirga sp. MY04 TaxID=1191459 RepID=UPI0008063568|nr:AI-2E family transporter [Flammeovirga sp. MY04]ANQ48159.1 AI-2E family transporter [Flammeovirga sp. MY04]